MRDERWHLRAVANARAGRVDYLLGRRALVEVRQEEVGRREERPARDDPAAAVGPGLEHDPGQRARIADGEDPGAPVEVEVGGDQRA